MIEFSIYKIKRNPIKFFLLKLVMFCALVFILDFTIGKTLSYFYFRQESGLLYRTTYSIEKTTADVLIFGSSRANHHYVPDILENQLNLSCYNVGRDGNYILYHAAVLKGVLKRYSPKMVILDFRNGEFEQKRDGYDQLSSLLPYYNRHPEMRSIIELKSKFEKLKLLSYIYPYNSLLVTTAVGNTEFNKKRRSDIKGYVPLKKVWNGTIPTDSSTANYEIDSAKVKAYDIFIQNCIQSKVKLYIVCSPYLVKRNHLDKSNEIGQEIAKKFNIPFYDYSNNSEFINTPKLFADVSHLNDEGAKIFSQMIVDKLNSKLEASQNMFLGSSPLLNLEE